MGHGTHDQADTGVIRGPDVSGPWVCVTCQSDLLQAMPSVGGSWRSVVSETHTSLKIVSSHLDPHHQLLIRRLKQWHWSKDFSLLQGERYTWRKIANVCQKCGSVQNCKVQDRIQYKINHKVAMSGNFCMRGLSLIYDEAGLWWWEVRRELEIFRMLGVLWPWLCCNPTPELTLLSLMWYSHPYQTRSGAC